jgi:putative aldouronate transport system permease protein
MVAGTVRRKRFDGADILIYSVMLFIALSMVYPFWELIIVSFMTPEEASQFGFKIWAQDFTLRNYRRVLQNNIIGIAYRNTIIRTIAGVSISMILTFMAAYPLSKRKLPFNRTVTFLFTFTMFFQGGLIPTYLLIRGLGLLNSLVALIFVHLLTPFHIFMVRNYIASVPISLEESATMDGATYFTILTKIVMPVCKPILATLALWLAVLHWNQWFDAMIYTTEPNLITLQLYLRNIIIENTLAMEQEFFDAARDEPVFPESLKAVNILLAIGPIVFIYPFIQKYFIKGSYAGAVKG